MTAKTRLKSSELYTTQPLKALLKAQTNTNRFKGITKPAINQDNDQ